MLRSVAYKLSIHYGYCPIQDARNMRCCVQWHINCVNTMAVAPFRMLGIWILSLCVCGGGGGGRGCVRP